jgi:hypothetical protein
MFTKLVLNTAAQTTFLIQFFFRKSWENLEKTLGKSWEKLENILGNFDLENLGKKIEKKLRKSLKYLGRIRRTLRKYWKKLEKYFKGNFWEKLGQNLKP